AGGRCGWTPTRPARSTPNGTKAWNIRPHIRSLCGCGAGALAPRFSVMLFFRRLRSRALAPGRYLTDGRRLVRVLSKFDDGRSGMALVEDCTTFESFCYALLELGAMGFRPAGVAR